MNQIKLTVKAEAFYNNARLKTFSKDYPLEDVWLCYKALAMALVQSIPKPESTTVSELVALSNETTTTTATANNKASTKELGHVKLCHFNIIGNGGLAITRENIRKEETNLGAISLPLLWFGDPQSQHLPKCDIF